MKNHSISLLLVALVALTLEADQPDTATNGKAELSKLQDYVGGWRGVGQVRRGSSRGAWSEKADWAWKFEDDAVSLTFDVKDSQYFESGELTAVEGDSAFQLKAKSKDQSLTYVGKLDADGRLVLLGEGVPADKPARISLRQVAGGKRMLMLFERRIGDDRFQRLAEVGYTREGSSFGKGTNYIECVVTGGVGTMPVKFEGKTYYVCCTGCRDYFNDDPAAVMADYRERKAEEDAKETTD